MATLVHAREGGGGSVARSGLALTVKTGAAIVTRMAKATEANVSIAEAARRIERSARSIQRALKDPSLARFAVLVEGGRVVAVRAEGLAKLQEAIRPGPGNPTFGKKRRKK
jgi:hypothetical protein